VAAFIARSVMKEPVLVKATNLIENSKADEITYWQNRSGLEQKSRVYSSPAIAPMHRWASFFSLTHIIVFSTFSALIFLVAERFVLFLISIQ
jgi:hypothetical protein